MLTFFCSSVTGFELRYLRTDRTITPFIENSEELDIHKSSLFLIKWRGKTKPARRFIKKLKLFIAL